MWLLVALSDLSQALFRQLRHLVLALPGFGGLSLTKVWQNLILLRLLARD